MVPTFHLTASGQHGRHRSIHWILAVCLGLGVLLAAFILAAARQSLERYESSARRTVESLSLALEEDLAGAIYAIDLVLQATVDEVERQNAAGKVDRQAMERFLARNDPRIPQALGLRVADSAGTVQFAISGMKVAYPNIADMEHFAFLREHPDAGLYVSKPVLGRGSGKIIILFARRWHQADGSFGGVVQVAVEVRRFTDKFTGLNVGPHGTVALWDNQLVLAVRHPSPDDETDTAAPPMLARLAAGEIREGAEMVASPGTGIRRLHYSRRIDAYPLLLSIGLAESDYLAGWRREVLMMTGLAMLFYLATLSTLALLWHISRQRIETAEALAHETARTNDALRRSNADLEQFAYCASHDLREPLRMVMSYLTLLERRLGDSLDQPCRDFIGFARDGAARMDHLIRDLLDYSRVGRTETPPAAVDLKEIADEVIHDLGVTIEEASATINVAPDLPRVLGHREDLARVLQNLISNAVKYRAPGRPPVIRVTWTMRDGLPVVTVADNGIGFAPENADRIFGIFQRLHGRGEYEGTGIGLAVCRKIVETHGGTIWAESEPGAGSAFSFSLPPARA